MSYTPRISITLMRYIPVRGHAKVQVCTSRGVHEFLLSFFLQPSMCTRVNTGTCVRTLYKRGYINYPRIIVSAHNTLYVCKTAKTNTVSTTRMLRKRLCPALGARPVVCGFYTYDGSLTRTALSIRRGLSRRRSLDVGPSFAAAASVLRL